MSGKVVVFCFSSKGRELAKEMNFFYSQMILISDFKKKKLRDCVEEFFEQGNLLIFVGAAGIAVRGIAPFVRGKDVDPAVVVVDELGKFVIPLLSGHLGGANACAQKLAKFLNATPVITTATDINKVFAVDVWSKKEQLHIHNIENIKYISSAVLAGRAIGFISDYEDITLPSDVKIGIGKGEDKPESGILIADEYRDVFFDTLWMTPKNYIVGVGCRKNFEIESFEVQLLDFLKKNRIPIPLIKRIVSIDLKADEEAILSFSKKHKIPFQTFSAEELQNIEGEFHKSEFVESVTGVDNVCERSAMLASEASEIYIGKTLGKGMTIAVARSKTK